MMCGEHWPAGRNSFFRFSTSVCADGSYSGIVLIHSRDTLNLGLRHCRAKFRWISDRPPEVRPGPVIRIAVIPEEFSFMLTGNRFVSIDIRAVLYLILG